jgi:hypothetical protein
VTVERRFSAEGGYAGDEAVAAGDVTLRTFEAAGVGGTVVVLGVIADEVDVMGVGNVTSDLAAWFPAGEERARTSVFVLPAGTDFGAAGVAVGGGDFLVTASLAGGEGDVSPGVFAYEYTHTRQPFRTGSEMAWFTEGSARYYEHRYGYERRHRSFGFYDRAVFVNGAPYANATLNEVHPTSTAAYQKGAHVLTALDVLMRQRTDGEVRVDDLLDRANAHDGELTYGDLTPRRYVFAEDTTLTFRSAYDPADVTRLDVTVVEQSTPTVAADTGEDGDAPRTATAGSTEPTIVTGEGRSTTEAAEVDAPPLVIEPRASGLLIRRGAVTALFPLPVLVWMVGFLGCVAGGTYLVFCE